MIVSIRRCSVLGIVLVALLAVLLYPKPASAAAVKGFVAGNIIDDSVFTSKNSMSVSQIQSFLNSKVKTCDTNGAKSISYHYKPGRLGNGNDPVVTTTRKVYGQRYNSVNNSTAGSTPFTCLKNYSQNGKSAAQIIYNTAQTYSISPKVLIVTLQKEQGLVTDDWPWPKSSQYKYAMGFACTDSAPCDSTFAGLTKQIQQAARHYRNYFDEVNTGPSGFQTPYTRGVYSIQWNPDSSCGSSNVNIQNRATGALYSYTPYRPNQAALNAGYGTGNGCSAYGNRNFYLYFKDWFGSVRGNTQPFRLISCSDDKYLVERGKRAKRLLTDNAVTALGFTDSTFASGDGGCSYPTYSLPLDRSFRSRTTSKVYVTDNKKAYRLQGATVAQAWGLLGAYQANSSQLPQLNGDVINSILRVYSSMPYLAASTNTSKTYLVDNGNRYFVSGSPSDTASLRLIKGYDSLWVGSFTPEFIQTLTDNGTVDYAFKVGGTLYLFDHGKIRKISPSEQVRWENAVDETALSSGVLKLLPQETVLSKGFRRDSLYYRVTLDGDVQSTTSASTANSWSVSNAPIVTNLLRNKLTDQ